jgi:hypothetical protein
MGKRNNARHSLTLWCHDVNRYLFPCRHPNLIRSDARGPSSRASARADGCGCGLRDAWIATQSIGIQSEVRWLLWIPRTAASERASDPDRLVAPTCGYSLAAPMERCLAEW